MTTQEMIAVMQAHVDGKPIERRGCESPQWIRVEAPNWDWSDCEYRIAPIAPGHNPAGLTVAQVGDGYRLLDEDEVDGRWLLAPPLRQIEVYNKGSWDNDGWCGAFKSHTYRTKLSWEELARLRNPVAPGHNPAGLTVAQVGDGYRLLDEDEVDERWKGTPIHRKIEAWCPSLWWWDGSGWRGDAKEITYRTDLSREELARLRNPVAPGHNPDGLTVAQVGDGYRLLGEDEVGGRYSGERSLREIECFVPDGTWDASGWWGDCKEHTFRTKLSREELARLREAKPEPSVTIPKSEYERLQQAAEVVAKLQASGARPSPPPQPGPSDPASPTPTGQ